MRNDEFCNIFSNQQQEAHSNRARFQYNVSYIIDCFNKNEPESMIEANKNDIKNIEMSEKAEIYAIYDQYADEDERLERNSQNI